MKWFLRDLYRYVMPTGSRVICPQVVESSSDYDFIALVTDLKAATDRLHKLGFEVACSLNDDAGEFVITPETKFVSLKLGPLNVIATQDQAFFNTFMLATRTATKLGLVVKSQRITLFQAVLYGNA